MNKLTHSSGKGYLMKKTFLGMVLVFLTGSLFACSRTVDVPSLMDLGSQHFVTIYGTNLNVLADTFYKWLETNDDESDYTDIDSSAFLGMVYGQDEDGNEALLFVPRSVLQDPFIVELNVAFTCAEAFVEIAQAYPDVVLTDVEPFLVYLLIEGDYVGTYFGFVVNHGGFYSRLCWYEDAFVWLDGRYN